ncbi:MAG: hypothetical protein HGA62_10510 [Chlorobiaceae bacterium]|nr:hypothetical protein [Chlorobiaceae bacterium]NTV60413.1 hypothetical protein [Chlorobiaceae bacterium]
MANNNGVFSDLFEAVGAPVQNVADTVGNGVNSVISVAQSCTNVCTNLLTSTAAAGLQFIQSVVSGISTAIAPKQ